MKDALALPPDFTPREQWPEFSLAHIPPPGLNPQEVGEKPKGLRWGIRPLILESYTSDDEPVISPGGPLRIILWNRVTRTDTPRGWRAYSRRGSKTEGYALLTQGEDYTRHWMKSARWYRNKWISKLYGKKYVIEPMSYEAFANAYALSSAFVKAGRKPLDILERNVATHAPVRMWGVRELSSGCFIAGMAVLDSAAYKSSYYACGFVRREWSNDPVMTGLIDRWFSDSIGLGMRTLHFGEFWQKGKPAGWKGFSQFKSGFGAHLIPYPPALIRIQFGLPRFTRWFYERHLIPSTENGSIDARRVLGAWHVWVYGCQQTGGYVHAMWKDALRRVNERAPVQHILMLGLGGGGEVKQFYKRFPGCRIIAVEHDREMLSLARRFSLWRPFPPPRMLHADAADALASLPERFDLIIVDIFRGSTPSPLLANGEFLRKLREHLAPGGVLLLNAYRKAEYLDAFGRFFGAGETWTFRLNRLGLFRAEK